MSRPLPLDLLVSGRDLTEPRLSPDGRAVAFVQRAGGSAAISVVGLEPVEAECVVTFGVEPAPGRGLGGGCFDWLPNSAGIVFCGRDGELWEIEGAELRQLTTHERDCRAPVVTADGSCVVHVVDEAEVWMTERSSGRSSRVDDGHHEFCFDPAVAPGGTRDGALVSWIGWSPPAMPWDAAERVDARIVDGRVAALERPRPVSGAVQQPRFATDGTPTAVDDASGWLNVTIGERRLDDRAEHAGPTWGMGQRSYAVRHDGAVVVARNLDGFGELTLVAADGGRIDLDPEFVGTHGQLSVVGDRLCALRSGPTSPPEVVIVDAGRAPRVVAAGGVRAWAHVELPTPEPLTTGGADGALHARRYPALAPSRGLLCWVHGGPTDQWTVDFRPRIAYWCSRGWDVLVVDPRGTTGHGRDHQQALHGGWGRIDVDDTIALLEHAHAEGWSTPATTVAVGGSSGGLTVLGVLADRPDLVAGGIASYPVSDLRALTEVTHRFEAHYTETLVGPSDDPGIDARFVELSPVHRADRIRGPLLLFHGTDDPVVPIAQSESLVERIRKSGGTVDYVVYEGEGHGFRDPANVRDEYERTERFLDSVR